MWACILSVVFSVIYFNNKTFLYKKITPKQDAVRSIGAPDTYLCQPLPNVSIITPITFGDNAIFIVGIGLNVALPLITIKRLERYSSMKDGGQYAPIGTCEEIWNWYDTRKLMEAYAAIHGVRYVFGLSYQYT